MSQIREISEAFLYLFKMVSKKKIQRERIQKVFFFFTTSVVGSVVQL